MVANLSAWTQSEESLWLAWSGRALAQEKFPEPSQSSSIGHFA